MDKKELVLYILIVLVSIYAILLRGQKSQLKIDRLLAVNSSQNYVVMSCSAPEKTEKPYHISYIFYLPITAAVWHSFGYDVFIVLTGPSETWKNDLMPSLVIDYLRNLSYVQIHFLNCNQTESVLLAQVSRLLAPNFLPNLQPNDFLISTDVDFWPTQNSYLQRPPSTDIHITSPLQNHYKGCCYRYVASSCVGMKARVWNDVINFNDVKSGVSPYSGSRAMVGFDNPFNNRRTVAKLDTPNKIFEYLETEFGKTVVHQSSHKNKGKESMLEVAQRNVTERTWFLDQILISKRLAQYIYRNGDAYVYFSQKPDKINRISRGKNFTFRNMEKVPLEKTSAHLPLSSFLPPQWKAVLKLFSMVVEDDKLIEWVQRYRDDFCDKYLYEYKNRPR